MRNLPKSAYTNLTAPPPSRNHRKINGFTLAETLITLMIIGVIAALTIPGLSKNMQSKELAAQAKKAMATLNGAKEKAELDMGYVPRCNYWMRGCLPHSCVERNPDGSCKKFQMADGSDLSSDVCGRNTDCSRLMKSMLNNLNIARTCESNAYAGGCIPAYKGNDTVLKDKNPDLSDYDVNASVSGCGGFRESNIRNNLPAYILADGMIIFPYGRDWAKIIAVDVNGKKGPNKWGYDIIQFQMKADLGSSPIYYPGGCEFTEPGGKSAMQMIYGK